MNENLPDAGQLPPNHPIVDFTFADLTALLRRATRLSAVLGLVAALFLWLAMGWRTAALFAIGAALSIGSIYEWGRLIGVANARMEGQRSSGLGVARVVGLFLVRLALFAAVIYGSLKCFQGANYASPVALLCGLGLGLAGFAWQAIRVLRG